jgi:hypothetical protein
MKSKYREAPINQAPDEIAEDKEASENYYRHMQGSCRTHQDLVRTY